jgi:hypothetical protein
VGYLQDRDHYAGQVLDPAQRLAALVRPASTVGDLGEKIAALAQAEDDALPPRVRAVVRRGTPHLSITAKPLTPEERDAALNVIVWPLSVQTAFEAFAPLPHLHFLWDVARVQEAKVELVSAEDLLSGPVNGLRAPQTILRALAVLDVVIAQQSLLAGDLVLASLYDDLVDVAVKKLWSAPQPQAKDCPAGAAELKAACERYARALQVLFGGVEAGATLRENFSRYVVARAVAERAEAGFAKPGRLTYAVALAGADTSAGLKAALGDQWPFERVDGAGGYWAISLASPSGDAPLRLRLPAAEAFDRHPLVIPPALQGLVALRDRLADTLASYGYGGEKHSPPPVGAVVAWAAAR